MTGFLELAVATAAAVFLVAWFLSGAWQALRGRR